ncbi:acyltransferase family protein [Sodalis sp. RH20]|uniref:acyltransferase family protein n=1 Tax=unclassified Sodalis (in: enterobacteria) TaxID=2636512 RepID=UPI0039B38DFF
MKQEIRSLTGLRGLAAVLVMFYHYNSYNLIPQGFAYTFVRHGYLMVDLFFVLSGYVMAMTYGRMFQGHFSWVVFYTFLTRRIARIYPLYILMIIPAAVLIATGWMDRWPGPPVHVSAIINLTMLQSLINIPTLNTPGWSISTEWFAYLIFPLLAFFCLRSTKWAVVIISLFLLFALPYMTTINTLVDEPKRAGILDIWNYGTVYPIVRCLIEFSMGMIAYRATQIKSVRNLLGSNAISLVIAIGIIITMCIKQADILFAFLLPLFMIAISQSYNITSKFLSIRPIYWLGELSFAIYMIHDVMIYFIVALARWLAAKGVTEHTAMLIFTLLFGFIVIGLSQIAYSYIEKPARKWTRRLLKSDQLQSRLPDEAKFT